MLTENFEDNNWLVSIILPVYNVEKYLDECLMSIKNQSFQNFEIIAINDGSTDESLSILENWKRFFCNKLMIYTQCNQGLSVARNNGLKRASGKYIYFMDPDDVIHPQLLQSCIPIMEEYCLKGITFNRKDFFDYRTFKNKETVYDWYYDKKYGMNYVEDYNMTTEKINFSILDLTAFNNLFKKRKDIGVWQYIYLKDTIKDIPFVPKLIHEDFLFDIKAIYQALPIGYCDNTLIYHRIRNNSITTTVSNKPKSVESLKYIIDQLYILKKESEIAEYRELITQFQEFAVSILLGNETYSGLLKLLNHCNKLSLNKKMVEKSIAIHLKKDATAIIKKILKSIPLSDKD